MQLSNVRQITNKIPPCRHYILTQCKAENCKFRHDEKMRAEYLRNPCCPKYKKTGSCKYDSKCIFSGFHKNCKFFEKNECKKPNCSYYHDPKKMEILTIPKMFLKFEKPRPIMIHKFLPTSSDIFLREFENKLKINMKENKTTTLGEKDEERCVICLDKKVDHVALPCGHLNYCSDCSTKLTDCAICRGRILKMQKVYH